MKIYNMKESRKNITKILIVNILIVYGIIIFNLLGYFI